MKWCETPPQIWQQRDKRPRKPVDNSRDCFFYKSEGNAPCPPRPRDQSRSFFPVLSLIWLLYAAPCWFWAREKQIERLQRIPLSVHDGSLLLESITLVCHSARALFFSFCSSTESFEGKDGIKCGGI